VLGLPVAALAQAASVSSSAPSPPTIAPPQSLPKTQEAAGPDRASRIEGRLFFTPQERQRIDEARKRGLVLGDDGQMAEQPSSVLNGFVKRSDGHTAVWVDGVPRWDAKTAKAGTLAPTDVGGPAAYLKYTSAEPTIFPTREALRAKKPAKLRAKVTRVKKSKYAARQRFP
jgi:hypothetical protein